MSSWEFSHSARRIQRRLFWRSKFISTFLISLLLFPLGLMASCSSLSAKDGSALEEVYLPPSPVATTIPTPVAEVENLLLPTPTVACTNSLLFISDRTLPDGTEVEPGAILDKIWEVENNGTCNFDENYRLKLIGGLELGANPEQALYPARSGVQFQIHIRFVAPQEAGAVRSAWQAFDPNSVPFGDPIYMEVVVK